MNRAIFFLLANLLLQSPVLLAQSSIGFPSGDAELDELRLQVQQTSTTHETFKLRAIKMKLWAVTLQQLGVRLDDYVEVDPLDLHNERWLSLILTKLSDIQAAPTDWPDAHVFNQQLLNALQN